MHFYTHVKQHRNKILLAGYEGGKRYFKEINYKPYLFISSQTDSKYKTIQGQPVKKIVFDSIPKARDFIQKYEDVDGINFYGLTNFPYVYIFDTFKEIKYDTSLIKTAILDIEVSTADGNPDIDAADKEVTAITCQYNNIIFTFGLKDYTVTDSKVKYFKCKDEKDLLEKFVKLWSSDVYRPDVVTGWNVEFFDIPYLIRRITKVLSEEEAQKLSPWKLLEEKTITFNGRDNVVSFPVGINILDYFHLYQKFTYSQQESYKLDHIAFVELGENKLDYSEYESLDDLYNKNFQKFIDYNIHDCELVRRLDEKMKLLELVYVFAYDAGINFADTLTSVRSWDVIIHNYLLTYKKVVPHIPRKSETENRIPVGAFVKDPKIGMHDWVVSFDLTSLYPHLIMGYNISPDTFRGKLKNTYTIEELLEGKASELHDYLLDNDVSFAANSCTYTKKFQGFLGALMEDLFEKRKMYKKEMLKFKEEREKNGLIGPNNPYINNMIAKYENLQMAKKIQLNSCYGALANQYFRWYDLNYAESITISGQLTIRWAEKYLNEYLNTLLKTDNVDYVIAVDTDSLYVKFSDVVKKSGLYDKNKIHDMLTNLAEKKIQPYFDKTYQNLSNYMNCYKQCMNMKLEIVSDRSIFVAKKRYIANVLSSEGVKYETPKMKIMGIEAVRSSTPSSCRSSIKDALKIIMTKTEDDLREFIEEFRDKFKQMTFEDVAFPRSVNGLNKYKDEVSVFKKATPIHVRGALIFNKILTDKQLDKKYSVIFDRDKIKFCYLSVPNPVQSNVLAIASTLPKELKLDKYIDYDTQFEKAFLDPMKTILDAIGWRLKKENTLENFFIG